MALGPRWRVDREAASTAHLLAAADADLEAVALPAEDWDQED